MVKPIRFFNTATRAVEDFKSITPGKVKLYCCGPTVYNFAHIGNLRTYLFEDILRRTLLMAGYDVQHVMNITDVGHLQSDADEGDDKMSVAAAREQKSPWDIARDYEAAFVRHVQALNILMPTLTCRATEHIPQMIAMVEELIAKGHAYESGGNVYYDVASFPTYNDFARLRPQEQLSTDRVEKDERKRNQQDFALWFSVSKYPNQIMQWDSPWGRGFPGWHIECSAMASHYLGHHFDIHCGGIDHIPVHHTNEIAQSEGCFGHDHSHPWVNYWLHGEFLNVDKGKMSKSSGSFLHLDQLVADGYEPLDYRFLLLTAHYRSPLRFSYEALDGARNTRTSLRNLMQDWSYAAVAQIVDESYVTAAMERFFALLGNDLAIQEALAYSWSVARDDNANEATRKACFIEFDKIFGLNLDIKAQQRMSAAQQALFDEREAARAARDWASSDRLRDELLSLGIRVKDRRDGVDWELV